MISYDEKFKDLYAEYTERVRVEGGGTLNKRAVHRVTEDMLIERVNDRLNGDAARTEEYEQLLLWRERINRTDLRERKKCAVPTCERDSFAKSVCNPHYQQMRREGVSVAALAALIEERGEAGCDWCNDNSQGLSMQKPAHFQPEGTPTLALCPRCKQLCARLYRHPMMWSKSGRERWVAIQQGIADTATSGFSLDSIRS